MHKVADGEAKIASCSRVMPNGLQVTVVPRRGYRQTCAALVVRYGAVDREFLKPGHEHSTVLPDGVPHFLEHKMFERRDGTDYRRLFTRNGASVGAYTRFACTLYTMTCTAQRERNLLDLLAFAQELAVTEASVERERLVIEREIRMYEDRASWIVHANLLKGLYGEHHPFAVDIAGTVESIQKIDKGMLEECFRLFYHPRQMTLLVTGDIEPERVFDLVAADQSRYKAEGGVEVKRVQPSAAPVRPELLTHRMPVSATMLRIGYRDSGVEDGGARLAGKLCATRVGLEALVGEASSLTRRWVRQGLIGGKSAFSHYHQDAAYAHSIIGVQTSRPHALLEELDHAFAEALEKGIPEAEFHRARRKLLGRTLMECDDLLEFTKEAALLRAMGADHQELREALKEMTLEQVNARLADHLRPELRALSVVSPM